VVLTRSMRLVVLLCNKLTLARLRDSSALGECRSWLMAKACRSTLTPGR
jgi:hypothetical protein